MRRMGRILHVARNDLRLMVRDKAFFVWTLAFPIFFIVVFGLVFKAGDNAPAVQKAAMVSPAYWAMDALHALRFFQGGLRDILPHLGVLLALAAVLSALAARTFRVRD